MDIKKLEVRKQWICRVGDHSYVRTNIEWGHNPATITWHLNEDHVEGVTYLNDDELEKLFWKLNVKKN